ncbi:hypothetical protein ANN_01322 [Periplaneta americana]|uniref:Uncharacterized protein n=1 Tax=Periplaneta americana TaxID=6978 RepID=A0ABQ8TW93_PERAM|nr:hypothetical protein ANN_01322 [Periplaneta americana]
MVENTPVRQASSAGKRIVYTSTAWTKYWLKDCYIAICPNKTEPRALSFYVLTQETGRGTQHRRGTCNSSEFSADKVLQLEEQRVKLIVQDSDHPESLCYISESILITKVNDKHKTEEDGALLDKVCFSDKTTFHMCGKVNRHNYCIWGSENPREVEKDSPKLNRDGAPPHFAVQVRECLNEFPSQWIGRSAEPLAWPPHSPDVTSLDLFLWNFMKNQVHRTPVENLDHLRRKTDQAITNVTPQMLLNIWTEVE